ncbi:hypothetical protein HZS_2728 [Henneguya salminicola]|nr:hypothetical protein HZS_2728 [Henneguya salminicola]
MELDEELNVNESDIELEPTKEENYDDQNLIESDEIIGYKAKIAANPYEYDYHLKLISELRKIRQRNDLQKARENMYVYFPLTEQLWLEWLKDEISHPQSSKEYIIDLFEKAVLDYQSVKLWLEYCQYRMDIMKSRDEIDLIRKLFENAIISAGLHVSEGSSIWDGFRDFEQSMLSSFQKLNGKNIDPNILSQIENQKKRILSLFHRQLSIPHLSISHTKRVYDNWLLENGISPNQNLSFYPLTLKKLNECLEYEKELNKTEKNYSIFLKYIEYEKKCNNPVRVTCLYERAIAKNCLDEELWLNYIEYLSETLKDFEILETVHKRSLRNMPWLPALWISYMKTLELFEKNHDLIKGYTININLGIFDDSMRSGINCPHDLLNLRMHFGLYLSRRLIQINGDKNELISFFKDAITAQESYNFFHKELGLGEDGDPNSLLLKTLSDIYLYVIRDVHGSYECWKQIVKKYSHESSYWEQYLKLAKICSRFQQKIENLPDVTRISTIDKKRKKNSFESTTKRLKSTEKGKYTNTSETIICSQSVHAQDVQQDSTNKNIASDYSESQPTLDKNTSDSFTLIPGNLGADTSMSVFISNVDFNTTEDQINDTFSSIGSISKVTLVRNRQGFSKGYGYVQFVSPEEVAKALEKDRKFKIGTRPIYISPISADKEQRVKKFHIEKNTDCCLYVAKIHHKISEQELIEIFKLVLLFDTYDKYPGYKEARLATYRNGNSRGFAYIEFDTKENAAKALLKADGTVLCGQAISLHISKPPKKSNPIETIPKTTRRPVLSVSSSNETKLRTQKLSNGDFRKYFKNI